MNDVAPPVRRPVMLSFDASYPELGIRSFFKGTLISRIFRHLKSGSKRVFWIEPVDLRCSATSSPGKARSPAPRMLIVLVRIGT
jgi:hypothetical protein